MISKKQIIVVPILLILLCIIFYPVIFQGKIFSSPDSLNPKAAAIILEQAQTEGGEYPLWQPWIFSGMPTAESFTNTSNLYFLQYLFNLLHMPVILIHLLHFVLAGLGVYVLLRYLRISQYIAIVGAAGFMLMPYLITMEVFGHGSQAMTAAYIPWAFWSALKLFDKQRLVDIGLLAIILGLQLQRAHVQIAYYTWMLIGALFLFKIILLIKHKDTHNNLLKGSILFALAILLALGISALVYLPSIQYSSESIRSVGQPGSASYDYATSWSFHPKEMLTFLIPSAYGFGGQIYWGKMPFTDYPNYMGIIFLILAVIAVINKRDKLVWFLAGTTLLALLISFGSHLPFIYNLFYEFAPYFNKFRIPSMILIIVQFNVIILACFGLEELTKIEWKEFPKWFWWIVGLVGILVLILLFGGSWLREVISNSFTQPHTQDPRLIEVINNLRWKHWINDVWTMVALVIGFFASIFLLIKENISKLIFVIIIGILAIIDLGMVDLKIVQPESNSGRSSQLVSTKAINRYFQHDQITKFLSEDEENYRVYPIGQLFGESRLQAFGIESIGGYHPAKLGIYNRFLSNTNNISSLPLMRMMNVHYILSPQPINHSDLILVKNEQMQTGSGNIPIWIYRLINSFSRAWFVTNIEKVNEDELWQKIMDDTFNPLNTAYITDTIVDLTIGNGDILSSEYYPNYIRIDVNAPEGGFLVVSEVHYPLRWKALIDGEPVEIFETNGVVRGLVVPAGVHNIEFVYDQSVFKTGIIISSISTLIAIGLIAFGLFSIKKYNELV